MGGGKRGTRWGSITALPGATGLSVITTAKRVDGSSLRNLLGLACLVETPHMLLPAFEVPRDRNMWPPAT